MKKGLKINTLTHIPKAGRLIALVSEDEPSVPSSRSIERSSSGPGTSKRVFLATRTSRVTTLEVVLGTTERVFLSEGHPFLRRLDRSFQVEGTSGIVSASPSGLLLYHLELRVPINTLEGDALVSSLVSDRTDSPILEGVVDPVVLPGA